MVSFLDDSEFDVLGSNLWIGTSPKRMNTSIGGNESLKQDQEPLVLGFWGVYGPRWACKI